MAFHKMLIAHHILIRYSEAPSVQFCLATTSLLYTNHCLVHPQVDTVLHPRTLQISDATLYLHKSENCSASRQCILLCNMPVIGLRTHIQFAYTLCSMFACANRTSPHHNILMQKLLHHFIQSKQMPKTYYALVHIAVLLRV